MLMQTVMFGEWQEELPNKYLWSIIDRNQMLSSVVEGSPYKIKRFLSKKKKKKFTLLLRNNYFFLKGH